MEIRKITIYSIFVVTVAYGIYFHFLSDNSAHIPAPDISPMPTVDIPIDTTAIGESNGIIQDKTIESRPASTIGRSRNPFLKEDAKRIDRAGGNKRPEYTRPTVSAVSPGGADTFVIANGRLLRIGESIGVWKLMKAESGRALFAGPGGSIWVRIGGG
jgi:hypothetical protein